MADTNSDHRCEMAVEDSASPAVVDFLRSIPPIVPIFADRLSEALRELSQDQQTLWSLRDGAAGGTDRDRAAGAAWLSPRFGEKLPAERVIMTNGTQGALLLFLERFVGSGGLILAECLSYTPIDSLARKANARIEGLPLDGEGLLPEAFEAACRARRPQALYCNPTVHNPTTAIMSRQRRLQIADIARRHGVAIIEDDPLGNLHPDAPPPIAALAPDICWYIMGTTKCLAHGLRVAYLVAPSASAVESFISPVRGLSHWYPAPLSAAVVTRWIETGAAGEILNAIRFELSERQRLACQRLQQMGASSPAGAMHLWLRLPRCLTGMMP